MRLMVNSLQAVTISLKKSPFEERAASNVLFPAYNGQVRDKGVDSLGFHEVLLGIFHLGWPSRSCTASNADIWRVVGHHIEVRVRRKISCPLHDSGKILMPDITRRWYRAWVRMHSAVCQTDREICHFHLGGPVAMTRTPTSLLREHTNPMGRGITELMMKGYIVEAPS